MQSCNVYIIPRCCGETFRWPLKATCSEVGFCAFPDIGGPLFYVFCLYFCWLSWRGASSEFGSKSSSGVERTNICSLKQIFNHGVGRPDNLGAFSPFYLRLSDCMKRPRFKIGFWRGASREVCSKPSTGMDSRPLGFLALWILGFPRLVGFLAS